MQLARSCTAPGLTRRPALIARPSARRSVVVKAQGTGLPIDLRGMSSGLGAIEGGEISLLLLTPPFF